MGWFGLKGFVKVQLFNKSHSSLARGSEVMMGNHDGNLARYKIEEINIRRSSALMKFEGVDDRSSVEKFKDKFLFAEEKSLKRLPKGRWYVHDIVGCEVVTVDGEILGTVNEVYVHLGQDVWEVKQESKKFLVPVVNEFVKKVDVRRKKIIVEVIEGLIE